MVIKSTAQAAELLEKVSQNPGLIKQLTKSQLTGLAAEIRHRIIEVVATNGGHLAPNLGVVEMTLALLSCLNLPEDEVVWDVGHQCYPWKLMTGRAKSFSSIRTKGGLAGFPKRAESPYDVFDTGHSATSISAALGKLKVRDLKGEKRNIVAVIGDGALTGGLALEGLNHAGRLGSKFLCILNDNTMSIDPNVGAFSRYLNKIRTEPFYRDNRDYARDLIKSVPRIGDRLYNIVAKLEGSLKYLVVPGVVFEELGFTYLGPVDGHNIELLQETFSEALHQDSKPVLVHVKTVKGKGYEPAEMNKPSFHGTGPFDKANGKKVSKPGPLSYTAVFGKTMVQLAEKDERICAITAAMAQGTGLVDFSKTYPKRFFDVGIAEQHAVTLAAGMASEGYRPVVAIYSTFLQRAYDQVVHDVCLQELPVTFAIDRGGLVGEDGPTHHGVFDLSFLRHVPNMVLMAPKDEVELQSMVKTALESGKPAAVRYPRGAGLGIELKDEIESLPIGLSEWLHEGKELAIIAIGSMVSVAQEAAAELRKRGHSVGRINGRFVKPLDEGMLRDVAALNCPILTVEENALAGGFGSAILEFYEMAGIDVSLSRLGIPDKFISHGAANLLREEIGLSKENIVEQALQKITPGRVGEGVECSDTSQIVPDA